MVKVVEVRGLYQNLFLSKMESGGGGRDEFLDVIYWTRQILGVILGFAWGLIPLQGFIGLASFCLLNVIILYSYTSAFQKIDDEEFGGIWELLKEGFMTSFASFLVTWIMVYSAMHFD
ncbi:Uncharacterized protein C20orf24 [Araneus ventricosus]|uniref:Uncharacterized protein C20orf24 n=1 Tax=Araneus ventricosus TaxID=182803 RepID=A0A4Y2DA35_ARAVE|nr:Uncharacterized protein C20orf24 [Araneus ventricosus]